MRFGFRGNGAGFLQRGFGSKASEFKVQPLAVPDASRERSG